MKCFLCVKPFIYVISCKINPREQALLLSVVYRYKKLETQNTCPRLKKQVSSRHRTWSLDSDYGTSILIWPWDSSFFRTRKGEQWYRCHLSYGEMKDHIYNKQHIYTKGVHTHTRWSSLLHISSHLTLTITTKGWNPYVYFFEMKEL